VTDAQVLESQCGEAGFVSPQVSLGACGFIVVPDFAALALIAKRLYGRAADKRNSNDD
jgi:hypothetical protein